MIDRRLRDAKDRAVAPVVSRLARVPPTLLTFVAVVAGVCGGVAAGFGLRWWAIGVWLLGRLFDGLDGAVARRGGRQSDLGGYLDMMGDTVSYAAVPIGIAVAQGDELVWAMCTVLVATFYVNAVSWMFLSAVAEKRRGRADSTGRTTTIDMPAGLVEGAETIVFFVVVLAMPDRAAAVFGVMAVLVVVTIAQRVSWAVRHLASRVDAFQR